MKKILNSLLVVALLVGLFLGGLYFNDIKSWATSQFERGQIIDGGGDGNGDNGGDNGGDIEINSISFAQDDWSIIAQVSKAIATGEENIWYEVGDEKNILIGEEIYAVHILGFNHDDLSDGSGKAGISIGMVGLVRYNDNSMNPSPITNVGGWDGSFMRNVTIQTVFSQLPNELQTMIKAVDKPTTAGNQDTSIVNSQDKLWLFSEYEVNGGDLAGVSNGVLPVQEGEQYEYWHTVKNGALSADRIKHLSTGTAGSWWLRTPTNTNSVSFYFIGYDGGLGWAGSSYSSIFICFGFCI